jgi:hypothetical protein
MSVSAAAQTGSGLTQRPWLAIRAILFRFRPRRPRDVPAGNGPQKLALPRQVEDSREGGIDDSTELATDGERQ